MPAVFICLALAASPQGKPKLIVLDLVAQSGMDESLAASFTDAVVARVAGTHYFEVTSSKDVKTLLGVERQRQLLGCSDQGTCLTELAGAVGAQYILSGQVGKVGQSYQLTLQMLDTQKAVPVGRTIRFASDLDALREQIPFAVADATGTPQPSPPSRILPYTLIAAGGAVVIGSGVLGLNAVNQEQQINQELASGTQLRSLSYYYRAQDTYGTQRTLALVGLFAGAALVGTGLWLNPGGSSGHAVAAVTPTGVSVGWAGTWR